MKYLHLLCFLFVYLTSFGQNSLDSALLLDQYDTVRFTVHFAKDRYEVNQEEASQLRDFLKHHWTLPKAAVTLSGHTDSDANDAYNLELSRKRCAAVQAIIDELNMPFQATETEACGEQKLLRAEKTNDDQAANRRVELTIVSFRAREPDLFCGGTYRSCPDTVRLPQGTLYYRDTCLLPESKECVQIKEFITPAAAREEGLLTQDEEGNGLASGGMLKYSICEDLTITAYIPLRLDCMDPEMFLYTMNAQGEWVRQGNDPLDIDTINGQLYYRVELSGEGMLNCDKLLDPPPGTPRVIFKAKKGLTLESIVWSCDCPFSSQRQGPRGLSKKKVKLVRMCCPELKVSIYAKDKAGNSLQLENIDVNQLKHAKTPFGCRSGERKRWFIFSIARKSIYRRYKILPSDFAKASSAAKAR